MNTRRLVLLSVCAAVALLLAPTAAATAEVTVTVNGEDVGDGDTVELD